ncbi:chorismate mutase1 [Zea mays]|uniref:chorismate mutase n=1 Tax=Zea mays TaxID=4577 RepID=A0A1D6GAX4_MAIZE|nr:chorismate mutase1 [Zea mays]
MAFKLITKPAAASPAAAYWGDLARGPQGTSRVAFGPAPRNKGLRAANNSATPIAKVERVDRSDILTLDSIRQVLIRLEDSIIFGLLERAQFCYNADTYDSNAFHMDGFGGSLVEYIVRETEKLHAQVGRYKSPDEHPFFSKDLPEPRLPPMQYPRVMHVFSCQMLLLMIVLCFFVTVRDINHHL